MPPTSPSAPYPFPACGGTPNALHQRRFPAPRKLLAVREEESNGTPITMENVCARRAMKSGTGVTVACGWPTGSAYLLPRDSTILLPD
jgi:hypothetical protein